MAATIIGAAIPFGLTEILPLSGFPAGKVRIRIRNDDLVKVFVKSETGIQEFHPEEKDGVWIPKYKIGETKRI